MRTVPRWLHTILLVAVVAMPLILAACLLVLAGVTGAPASWPWQRLTVGALAAAALLACALTGFRLARRDWTAALPSWNRLAGVALLVMGLWVLADTVITLVFGPSLTGLLWIVVAVIWCALGISFLRGKGRP